MFEPRYAGGSDEELYKLDYQTTTRDRAVERYEEMLEAGWMDDPLRGLLETRIEALLGW